MELDQNLKYSSTPLSVPGSFCHPSLGLMRRQLSGGRCNWSARSTSTPIPLGAQPPTWRSNLEQSSIDCSVIKFDDPPTPIFPGNPKINLASESIFDKKQTFIEGDQSHTTSVLTTLGKMELCENNNEPQIVKRKGNKVSSSTDQSTSSFQSQEQIKKQMKKTKYKLLNSPKRRSPKVHQVGLKRKVLARRRSKNDISFCIKKTTAEVVKKQAELSKRKSPANTKIMNKKTASNSVPLKVTSSTCDNQSKTPSQGSESGCKSSSSKDSRCRRGPKLRTAERAILRQQKEAIRREQEKELEALRIQLEEEKKRLEEEENMVMRKTTVFKAQPIRKYAPLPPVKKRELTDPITPNVSKRRRIEFI